MIPEPVLSPFLPCPCPCPQQKALLSLPVLSQLKVLIWTVNDAHWALLRDNCSSEECFTDPSQPPVRGMCKQGLRALYNLLPGGSLVQNQGITDFTAAEVLGQGRLKIRHLKKKEKERPLFTPTWLLTVHQRVTPNHSENRQTTCTFWLGHSPTF